MRKVRVAVFGRGKVSERHLTHLQQSSTGAITMGGQEKEDLTR